MLKHFYYYSRLKYGNRQRLVNEEDFDDRLHGRRIQVSTKYNVIAHKLKKMKRNNFFFINPLFNLVLIPCLICSFKLEKCKHMDRSCTL